MVPLSLGDGLRCAVLVEDLVLFVAGLENEG